MNKLKHRFQIMELHEVVSLANSTYFKIHPGTKMHAEMPSEQSEKMAQLSPENSSKPFMDTR